MLRSFSRRLAAGAAVVSLAACAASPLPPAPPAVADVLGTDKAPLVVDWPAGHRSDLAAAMADGVAVVRVEPKKITLLHDCHLPGTYGFVGFSTKEQLIRLDDAADVSLTLPLRGSGIAADLGGDLGATMALDVALVTVGRRRTTRASALRTALKGDECQGATHFVRGFDVGAFVLATAEKTNVSTVASLFGAKAAYARNASKSIRESDGELDACKQASPDDKTPPAHCSAALRLDLKAIDEAEEAETSSCGSGLVRAAGKCQDERKVAKKIAYECNPTNEAECHEQCEAGDATSCGHLASLLRRSTTKAPDFAAIRTIAERGCDKGSERACVVLGEMHQYGNGVGVDWKRADELFGKACADGDASGCFHQGTLYDRRPGLPVDVTKATSLYDRACRGGYADGCNNLGALALFGHGGPTDPARARTIYEEACKNGSAAACGNLADLLAAGTGGPKDTTRAGELWGAACEKSGAHCIRLGDALSGAGPLAKDPARALDAYQRGIKLLSSHCNLGIADRCDDLGWMFHDGHAVPRDDDQAFTFVKKGCDLGSPAACNHVGVFLENGWGVPRDLAAAKRKYAAACDAGNLHACVSRALGDGDEQTRNALFERACSGGVAVGCYHEGRQHRLALEDRDAQALLAQACRDGHAPACSYLGRWLLRERSGADGGMMMLEKGCTKGDLGGCATLGARLASSAADGERAETFSRRACDGGVASACATLADLAAKGRTKNVASSDGTALLQKACDGKNLSSCVTLAERVVAAEPGRAAGLLERACDLSTATPDRLQSALASNVRNRKLAPLAEPVGTRNQEVGVVSGVGGLHVGGGGLGAVRPPDHHETERERAERARQAQTQDLEDAGAVADERHLGCFALGDLHEKGNGFAKSVAEATPFYAAACTFDDGRGCARLAAIEGKQPKHDATRLAALVDRACSFGDADACMDGARRAKAERKYDLAESLFRAACGADEKRCPATDKEIDKLGAWTNKETTASGPLHDLTDRSIVTRESGGGAMVIGDVHTPGRADVRRVLVGARVRMHACYKRVLAINPVLEGKVVVGVKVDAAGEVTSADVMSDTTNFPMLTTCMTAAMKRSSFGPGPPTTIVVPVTFAPPQ